MRKIAPYAGMATCFVLYSVIFIAAIPYVGQQDESYSIFNHFISELGSTRFSANHFIYNSGIYYSLKVSNKEILSIYLPLLFSDEIADAIVLSSTTIENIHFLQRITFIFNIQEINPFQIIRNIAP